MSFMDKVMFWKHDDLDSLGKDFDLDKPPTNDFGSDFNLNTPTDTKPPGLDLSTPSGLSLQRNDFSAQPQQQAFGAAPQQAVGGNSKDIELISAKLDAIKAMLDSVNQRLTRIEQLANAETKKEQEVRW